MWAQSSKRFLIRRWFFLYHRREGGENASALMFNYVKKNAQFIKGEELGKSLKKKIEAQYGDILRAWHISEGAVEVR